MGKENIKILRERVNYSVKIYETALCDEEAMSNDLLDYAEILIRNQKRLIIALQNELRNAYLIKTDVEDLEKLALFLGSQEIQDTRDLIDKYNLNLNYREIDTLIYELYTRINARISEVNNSK